MFLLPALMLLTACGRAPGNFTVQMLPDIPAISKEDQAAAALELETHGAKVPITLNKILPACKITRDQTRAVKKKLQQK